MSAGQNPSLRAIGWPQAVPATWQAYFEQYPAASAARVVEQHRSGYVVAEALAQAQAVESLPEWARPGCDPASRAVVGDWVLIEPAGSRPQIVALLPRYSHIKRAAAGEHYRQQLIAANIDTAFVVMGLDGDFNPRRVERYLMLLQGSGVVPVVVLTKADTVADEAGALAALQAQLGPEVAICSLNARAAASVAVLSPWLQPGQTVVLVGSSGAGKSTLGNTLLGEARMKTGAVRAHDARGRHTTTHRALLALPSGACLIDTPGMRELKPTGEEQFEAAAFADIDALAGDCRFRDCRHAGEPGCAVQAAIADGRLDAGRLGNYRKLREEVAQAAHTLARRQAQGPRKRR